MHAPPERDEVWLNRGIVAVVLAVVFFVAARTHADPDLWGHVRFGQDILAGGIPSVDPYSYVSGDYPWINHELLAEISFAAVFDVLGVPGLVGLKVALVLITLGLVYWRLCSRGMNAIRAGMVVIAVLMLMSVGVWTIRPQLFTYLFFLLTLLLIDSADRGSRAALWALPAVVLLWVNSHGGFLAGLAVLGIWAALRAATQLWPGGRVASADGPKLAVLAAVLSACAAATLVNPYGPKLLAFLLRTATVARPEIGEWGPVVIGTPEGLAYLVVISVSVLVLIRTKLPRRPSLIAVLAATALLPLQAQRHLPLFALSFAVLAGEHLTDVWNRAMPSQDSAGRKLPVFVPFAVAAAFFVFAWPHFRCIRIEPSFVRFPVRAVAVMDRAGVKGNLATFFDWGEYILWHLSPNVRVSIDGRRETVYSPESYSRSMRFLYGVGEWDAILDDPRTDMALVGRDQPTYNLIRLKPGWQVVYEDSLSGLFMRDGSPQAEAIRGTVPPDVPADGAGVCFP